MDWRIDNIEALTESEAREMCGRHHLNIKGYECYFIDFGGYFGDSVIVFGDGRQIKYANDYELHHKCLVEHEGHYGLLKHYIEALNNKLFTEDELKVVTDYDDYERKRYYLANYYPLRRDYISIWFVGSDEERAKRSKQTESMIYNGCAFCYFNKEDEDFSKHLTDLMVGLIEARDKLKDSYEYWKKAFKSEMYNHEYGINWQADYDVLSCFGFVEYSNTDDELEQYFKQLGFEDTQRTAYMDARREYYKETEAWN